jgi:GntR family transcriptional repressor for pyruvate dehydrogenase complex
VLKAPRVAELVADAVRQRILSGQYRAGGRLARYEDITEEFSVSLPSVREAVRMLEAEGLVTIRRGKGGGAVVTAPRPENVAYGIGLVLESWDTRVGDLAGALGMLEPVCAAAWAETVVPELRRLQEAAGASIGDAVGFAGLARLFHEEIVRWCPNDATRLVVGAIESLWGAQVRAAPSGTSRRRGEAGALPNRGAREQSLADHAHLLDLIERGDAGGAEAAAREHFGRPERPLLLQRDRAVRAAPLRPT